MIDDSALIHGGTYDPQKAHEYYLRNRKLKGRKPRAADSPGGSRITKAEFKRAATGQEGRYKRTQVESQKQARAQAEQRLEDLQNRLDRLRDLLQQRVEAAKKRSGIEDQSTTKSASDKKSSSGKSGGSSADKPTAQERKEANKKAREEYNRNKKLHPSKAKDPSIQKQIEAVQKQIADVRDQLRKATADARKNSQAKSMNKTETSKGRRQ